MKSLPGLLALATFINTARGVGNPFFLNGGEQAACPLFGPSFPAPSHLANSTVFSLALTAFTTQLANKTFGVDANDTAWALSIFSAKEKKTLFDHYHTPHADVGVGQINRDSVFRIGSISKVFTVWTFLAAVGDSCFNDPITKYIPELASLSSQNDSKYDSVYDNISRVRWEEVTIGELASHAGGIPRDVGFGDLTADYTVETFKQLGLPSLEPDQKPQCGGNETQPPCTRKQFFQLLQTKTPTWPSSHSPAYSNMAFNLLGYALETMTGKDLETIMTESVFQRLNMTHSSYSKAPSSGGVVPKGAEGSWVANLGIDNAAGSLYMSTGDLATAGQAMLQSTLLKPAQTRRWFQPRIQTGYLGAAVGAPWEISYLVSPINNQLTRYVMKDGDLDATYHSAIVLVPDYKIGFTVLATGTSGRASLIATTLKVLLGETIMPAIEEQARIEAGARFNGTYTDDATNSSVAIFTSSEHAGLRVRSLVSRGVPVIGPGAAEDGPWKSLLSVGNDTYLFPTTLKAFARSSNAESAAYYESQVGFRATFQSQRLVSGVLQDPCVTNWGGLDGMTYGNRALDDWVFDMSEDGRAEGVSIRMLGLKFTRQV